MTTDQKDEFVQKMSAAERAIYLENMSVNEKAKYYADRDLFKTINILKGWISDVGEEE
jgi:flagellar M-ring protein FliF